jgi:hypothetical protein
MREIKDRWQFIIGFAAIIISLSAFKDELKSINLDYSFISFSLSQYLFVLIISIISVIHLYALPYIFSSSKYSNFKIFKYIESLSYVLFLIIILSPSLLFLIYLIKLLLVQITALEDSTKSLLMSILTMVIGAITALVSKNIVNKYQSARKIKEQSEIIEKEVKSFETTDKLIKDGYYNQSLFETFKMLEIGLYKILKQKDLIFRRGSFIEMINITKKYNIFSNEQIERINQIRVKRNEFAHNIDSRITKEEAENAQQLIREILTSAENVSTDTSDESESKYFKGKVYSNIKEAEKLSRKQNKPLFIIIFDKTHPKHSKLDHSLGYFMEYETTKRLVHDNFIQILTDSESPEAKELIPVDDPLENCLLTVVSPDNKIIKQEGVYANPDEGLKRVREIISKWNKTTSS